MHKYLTSRQAPESCAKTSWVVRYIVLYQVILLKKISLSLHVEVTAFLIKALMS